MADGPVRFVSLDPGEIHVGVAHWVGDDLGEAYEILPSELYPRLVNWLATRSLDELVIEEFRLYSWKAQAQSFSTFPTVEVIGVVQYLCDLGEIQCVRQPALIKDPTFAIMRRRGFAVPAGSQHIKDAVAHGYYRRNKGVIRVPVASKNKPEEARKAAGAARAAKKAVRVTEGKGSTTGTKRATARSKG